MKARRAGRGASRGDWRARAPIVGSARGWLDLYDLAAELLGIAWVRGGAWFVAFEGQDSDRPARRATNSTRGMGAPLPSLIVRFKRAVYETVV